MRRILSYLKPYTKECIVGPFFKWVEAVLELLLPTIMALIIDNGVAKRDAAYVLKMGALMLLMALLGIGSSLICQYLAARTSQGYGTALRNAVFSKISRLSFAEADRFGVSSLVNRVTGDINQLQLAVAMLIRLVIRAPFICIGAVVMAMILDLRLSVVLLIAAPLLALVLYLVIAKSAPIYTVYQKKMDRLTAVIRENLSGVRVIRAFAKRETEKKRFTDAADDLTNAAVRAAKLSALLSPLTSFLMNAAVIGVLWLGSGYIEAGKLPQGTLIAFINYLMQMLVAMIVVSNLVIIFTKAYASAVRVEEILAAPEAEDLGIVEIEALPDTAAAVEFKNVSFSYEKGDGAAIENVSFSIRKGEVIGITGATGSGKSMLVNLIGRFYEASDGEILVGGVNVKEYQRASLRRLIGMVSQKSTLFAGTIADNIGRADRSASRAEIEAAAKSAQADGFIRQMPDGYDTKLDRGGSGLSGGQKQRVSIARALLRKPSLLILDDATSALDYATEAELQNALKTYQDTTQLIVSQRIASIIHCSRILVLEDGKLCGFGTHEELIASCAQYADICRSQSEGVPANG